MDPDMIKRPNEGKYFQILQCHKLILSQTSGVNLMTVPNHVLELIKESIANYKADVGINEDVLAIAEIGHIFIRIKIMFLEDQKLCLNDFGHQELPLPPSINFLRVQEIMLEFAVQFMKGCPFFQSLPWNCKANLLR